MAHLRLADWLTYADINQLRKINQFYNRTVHNAHSKYELIRSLLPEMENIRHVEQQLMQMDEAERRFVELLVFDSSPSYTMEELLAKGRAALRNQSEISPRMLVVSLLKRGWLFPGYSRSTQFFYHLPDDLKEKLLTCLIKPYQGLGRKRAPQKIQDESFLLVSDLFYFLSVLQNDVIRLTAQGAIYKQQQRQILKGFMVPEEPLEQKGPRFGFGRMYHLYPDRFSLLYDYGYYRGYFCEKEGILCLTAQGSGKINKTNQEIEAEQIYRFWIRLYRRPIPHLPMLVRWIGVLAKVHWYPLPVLYRAIQDWLTPFYYESEASLFQKIIRMLVHLGVLQCGEEEKEIFVKLTTTGAKWIQGISIFREKEIEESFMRCRI